MSDGRGIRYYDSGVVDRSAIDQRPDEGRPGIGELRLDLLTGDWVAMAAHRQTRVFLPPKELCPLCPTKPGLLSEIADTSYQVVVFDNKSPSLTAPSHNWDLPANEGIDTPLTEAAGKCEVICFTDDHETSFGALSPAQIRIVMEAWRDRTRALSAVDYIAQVFPFENRGEEVGVTLNHPHGQIYAYSYITPRTLKMLESATLHKAKHNRILLDDIIARELKDEVRIIARNEHWIAYVPFAARYPFEIHVAPLAGVADLAELSDAQADDAWQGRTGFVHQAVMDDYPDMRDFQVYACGAPVMVSAARNDFSSKCHLPEEEFFADSFTSAADLATN